MSSNKELTNMALQKAELYKLSKEYIEQLLEEVSKISKKNISDKAKSTQVYCKAKSFYLLKELNSIMSEEEKNKFADNDYTAMDIINMLQNKMPFTITRRQMAEVRTLIGVSISNTRKFKKVLTEELFRSNRDKNNRDNIIRYMDKESYEMNEVETLNKRTTRAEKDKTYCTNGYFCYKNIQQLRETLKKGDKVELKAKINRLGIEEAKKVVEIESTYPHFFRAKVGNSVESYHYFDIRKVVQKGVQE